MEANQKCSTGRGEANQISSTVRIEANQKSSTGRIEANQKSSTGRIEANQKSGTGRSWVPSIANQSTWDSAIRFAIIETSVLDPDLAVVKLITIRIF